MFIKDVNLIVKGNILTFQAFAEVIHAMTNLALAIVWSHSFSTFRDQKSMSCFSALGELLTKFLSLLKHDSIGLNMGEYGGR